MMYFCASRKSGEAFERLMSKRGMRTSTRNRDKKKTLFCKKEILIATRTTHTHTYLKRQQQGKPTTLLSRGII